MQSVCKMKSMLKVPPSVISVWEDLVPSTEQTPAQVVSQGQAVTPAVGSAGRGVSSTAWTRVDRVKLASTLGARGAQRWPGATSLSFEGVGGRSMETVLLPLVRLGCRPHGSLAPGLAHLCTWPGVTQPMSPA